MQDTSPIYVLSIDPGRSKCGYALVRQQGSGNPVRIEMGASPPNRLPDVWTTMSERIPDLTVIVGKGTNHAAIVDLLKKAGARCLIVEEHSTTERARRRYFQDNPPAGWRRLIPLGLQTPPRPVDDYAALLIAEDYFKQISSVG